MSLAGMDRIDVAIADLYCKAEATRPNLQRPIAPLAVLIDDLNLRCLEIAGLTERAARESLARDGGPEPPTALSDEPLAGYLYVIGRHGAIFVRRNDPVQRRRFSVAHELGHYLLHFQPLLLAGEVVEAQDAFTETQAEPDDDQPSMPATLANEDDQAAYERREREADTFAARLLMPEDVVGALVRAAGSGFPRRDLDWRLATEMLVSQAAMARQLRALGLA
jgi:Zn-dependent peptidase ImmA (M78 family)